MRTNRTLWRDAATAHGVALHDVYRRTFLNLGAATIAAGVLGGTGPGPPSGTEVTESDLAQFDWIVARLRELDARHGAADLWDVAAARAQTVATILDRADYSAQVGQCAHQACRSGLHMRWMAGH